MSAKFRTMIYGMYDNFHARPSWRCQDDIFWKHANFYLAECHTEPLASEDEEGGRQPF